MLWGFSLTSWNIKDFTIFIQKPLNVDFQMVQKKGLNPDQAMGKIIQYLQSGSRNPDGPEYLKAFITPSHIEKMIDTIAL